jgi:hypothetical protein
MHSPAVAFSYAEAVEQRGMSLHCLVYGKRAALSPLLIQPGSDVWRPGDRGRLVIPRWLAIELNLVDVADRDAVREPRS